MNEFLLNILPQAQSIWGKLSIFEQVLLFANIVLLLFSRRIVGYLSHQNISFGYRAGLRLTAFRAFNLLLIAVIIFKNLFGGDGSSGDLKWYEQLLGSVLIAFSALLGSQVVRYILLKRFGKTHTVNDRTVMSETYVSRMLGIVSVVFIFAIAVIAILNILDLNNQLETTGVIGFLGVMLALTQGSWAPDIISGLIILNSGLIEDGDVIELDNGRTIGMIHKTRLFYTEVLNLTNNHRIMIGNARLRNMSLHNLSKFASAKGLREGLYFKIGYDVSQKEVKDCFIKAFENAECDKSIHIESQHPVEINMIEAGDDAIEWAVFYYTKNIRKVISTRNCFREAIFEEARKRNIVLATPRLHQIENKELLFTETPSNPV